MLFVDANRENYGVEPVCRMLPIAPSTYYEQKTREKDPSPVGSRAGAVLRRHGLSVSPRFLWECLTSRTVSPFPAPATSHAACGFPALRAPAHYPRRVM